MPPSTLFCFDFDHTVVDGNTDTWCIRALPGGALPEALRVSYQPGHWTAYMQHVFYHMHQQGVTMEAMERELRTLPFTSGFPQLLQHLRVAQGSSASGAGSSGRAVPRLECVILSDSNTRFIDAILSQRGHQDMFSRTYTNPSRLDAAGRLCIEPCAPNHGCSTCPVNMCKMRLLHGHRRERAAAGVAYDRVAYVGDGSNDLCPAQSLGPADVVFVRQGYALDKLLLATEQQAAGQVEEAAAMAPDAKALAAAEDATARGGEWQASLLKAAVVRWSSGHDILTWLQQHWGF